MPFDPNAAAQPDSGIFGLPFTVDEAKVAVLPVPYDATTSYAPGAARGPSAILEASKQVDLFDLETGKPYEQGIAMVELPREVARGLASWNREARGLVEKIIDAGGIVEGKPALQKAAARVNDLSDRVNSFVYLNAASLMKRGKLVAVLGGDHATPYGSIQAHAEAYPGLGVLHLDAHADLRKAFEGLEWSHASIMYNVVEKLPVSKLVQVGVRDFCEEELEFIRSSGGGIVTHFDAHLARARLDGVAWSKQCARIIKDLPQDVYVSFDIDGLDPALCPHTGTPVPGGISYHEASALLAALAQSGRRIVGFDLNEVSPGPDGDEWDANVGARLLYKMIGWALVSQARHRAGVGARKR